MQLNQEIEKVTNFAHYLPKPSIFIENIKYLSPYLRNGFYLKRVRVTLRNVNYDNVRELVVGAPSVNKL